MLSLWAKMQPGETAEHGDVAPSIAFELLDVNQSYAWIGHWRKCNLTHGHAWAKCSAEVAVPPSLASHDVRVSLIFGAVRASYLVDDIAVEQRHLTPVQPSRSVVLLSENFEATTRPPRPLAYGAHVEVRTSDASAAPAHSLHSAAAARKGSAAGAEVSVPAAAPSATAASAGPKVLLGLGKFHAVGGTLRLSVWAKASVLTGKLGLEVWLSPSPLNLPAICPRSPRSPESLPPACPQSCPYL